MKKKVLFIVGPTAVGKTNLSIELAQHLNGEIISGDSMQVYRHLDVGTSKVTTAEMKGIPHALINIKNVNERYSVADFCIDANNQINQITAQHKLPIVVGGTGFYIQALLYGLSLGGDHYQDDHFRQSLVQIAQKKGDQFLWQELNQIDPKAAQTIPFQNQRRIIRALEVCHNTDHLFSEQDDTLRPRYDAFLVGLNTERSLLYERINQRVDIMMQNGLKDEAEWLFNQGSIDLPAGKGIGYREWDPYFKGQVELNEVIEEIKKDSRHYAKRQLTWFRNKMNVHWYDILRDFIQYQKLNEEVTKWLKG